MIGFYLLMGWFGYFKINILHAFVFLLIDVIRGLIEALTKNR